MRMCACASERAHPAASQATFVGAKADYDFKAGDYWAPLGVGYYRRPAAPPPPTRSVRRMYYYYSTRVVRKSRLLAFLESVFFENYGQSISTVNILCHWHKG